MKKMLLPTVAVLMLATTAAGAGDRPYYCPSGGGAALSWAMPECFGASEYVLKRVCADPKTSAQRRAQICGSNRKRR
jgi:hypothetical protein